MNTISPTAMVLAAGLGTRMHPLTLQKPKPLLEVGDRTMLDQALDKLVAIGIRRAVVNTFYLAEQIEAHLARRYDLEIIISRETELLDTGGGIKNALHHFDGKPFFALNADLPWTDGSMPALARMKGAWKSKKMDALLLLMPTGKVRGFAPTGEVAAGDFAMDTDGRVYRQGVTPPRPYVWISAQILKPNLYESGPSVKSFSNNLIWNTAEIMHTLYGIEHDGSCYHVGTPEDLAAANDLLVSGRGWL
jgi:MurNAc alpha-1-phosphate uridylyltransferase